MARTRVSNSGRPGRAIESETDEGTADELDRQDVKADDDKDGHELKFKESKALVSP